MSTGWLDVHDRRAPRSGLPRMPALQVPGDWRLTVALHVGSVESSRLEEMDVPGGDETVDALNKRLSACAKLRTLPKMINSVLPKVVSIICQRS